MNDDWKFNIEMVELARLGEENLPHLANFDCNDTDMNQFFKEEAYDEQEKGLNCTILLYYQDNLAAFISLCCDAIPLNSKEQLENDIPRAKVPAVKIARIGRDIKYRDLGFGKFLIDYARDATYELFKSTVGVRFLTLDAYSHRVDYYTTLGFEINQGINPKMRSYGAISMRSDILPNDNNDNGD